MVEEQEIEYAPRPSPSAGATAAPEVPRSIPTNKSTRPLIPQVDFQELADTLLGDPYKTLREKTLLGQALVTDGGPARLFSPLVPKEPGAPEAHTLPLMFYMPGIDGTGLAAYRQFPRLTKAFDLRCLVTPSTDRTPFAELVETVSASIKAELDDQAGGRPVYLMGESFGGIMCLALAHQLGEYVDRLVIVNPASSFSDTIWPSAGPLLAQLPGEVYKFLPFALAPLMSNPIAMAMNDVDTRRPLVNQASDLMYGLIDLAPQLAALRLVLPADTLAWRLELLKEGSKYVNSRLGEIQQRVLVLAGDKDLLIPSNNEAERLGKKLPRCRARVLKDRSHALLQEAGIDLVDLMKAEGFYVSERVLSNGQTSTSASSSGSTAFGTYRPVQLPTPRELELDSEGIVSTVRTFCSPVFYSTLEDGQVVRGLGGIPDTRPLLLIGNHQLFAGDMYPMIAEFLKEKQVLPRGLAHPVVFAGPDAFRDPNSSKQQEDEEGTTGPGQFGSLLSTYGAVSVNGKNMHTLLSNGEWVLLYPGGAREAFKRNGEAYKLIWPGKAEFVRMAAKFGATIVPFAAIGADESITQVLDGAQVQQLQKQLGPLFGQKPEDRQSRIPRARVGVNATMEDVEAFGLPLIAPAVPQRIYFIFRKPLPTSTSSGADREACQELYNHVKSEVEDGMGYLLRMREQDPYKDFLPRLAYERSWGGQRQAPSFEP